MKKTIIMMICALVISLASTATVGILSYNGTYSCKETDAFIAELQKQLDESKTDLDRQIEKLTKDYKEKEDELFSAITINQQAIVDLDTKHTEEINLLKQIDAANLKAISDLTTEYAAKVAALETAIENLKATIEENKTELENKITSLTNVYKRKITEIDALLITLQNKTVTQGEKITELAEEITKLQNVTRITSIEFKDNGDLLITFGDGSTQTVNAPEKHVHTFGKYKCFTTDSTVCCEEGLFYRICTKCRTLEWKNGDYSDHNWKTVTTAPTCQSQGYDTKTCTICGKTEVTNYTDKVDHLVNDRGACTVCNKLVTNVIIAFDSEKKTYRVEAESLDYSDCTFINGSTSMPTESNTDGGTNVVCLSDAGNKFGFTVKNDHSEALTFSFLVRASANNQEMVLDDCLIITLNGERILMGGSLAWDGTWNACTSVQKDGLILKTGLNEIEINVNELGICPNFDYFEIIVGG